jgi:hypothetical protein
MQWQSIHRKKFPDIFHPMENVPENGTIETNGKGAEE